MIPANSFALEIHFIHKSNIEAILVEEYFEVSIANIQLFIVYYLYIY